MTDEKPFDIKKRTFNFALEVIYFVSKLPKTFIFLLNSTSLEVE